MNKWQMTLAAALAAAGWCAAGAETAAAAPDLAPLVVHGSALSQTEQAEAELRQSRRAVAIAFLQAKGTDKLIAVTFAGILDNQCKAVPELQPYRDVLDRFYAESLGFDALKDDLADLYLAKFTLDELKQLTAFYHTDLGKKLAAAETELGPEISLLFLKRQQEKMPELEKAIQQAAAARQ